MKNLIFFGLFLTFFSEFIQLFFPAHLRYKQKDSCASNIWTSVFVHLLRRWHVSRTPTRKQDNRFADDVVHSSVLTRQVRSKEWPWWQPQNLSGYFKLSQLSSEVRRWVVAQVKLDLSAQYERDVKQILSLLATRRRQYFGVRVALFVWRPKKVRFIHRIQASVCCLSAPPNGRVEPAAAPEQPTVPKGKKIPCNWKRKPNSRDFAVATGMNQVTTDTKAKHPNPPADATSLLFVRRVHRGSRLPAALFFKKKKINSLNKVSTINVNEAQLRA